jgi:hypothetical protein
LHQRNPDECLRAGEKYPAAFATVAVFEFVRVERVRQVQGRGGDRAPVGTETSQSRKTAPEKASYLFRQGGQNGK